MRHLLFNLIYNAVGRIFLHLKYKDENIRERIKDEEYNGEYSNAGQIVFMQFFIALFALFILVMIVTFTIGFFRNPK